MELLEKLLLMKKLMIENLAVARSLLWMISWAVYFSPTKYFDEIICEIVLRQITNNNIRFFEAFCVFL